MKKEYVVYRTENGIDWYWIEGAAGLTETRIFGEATRYTYSQIIALYAVIMAYGYDYCGV